MRIGSEQMGSKLTVAACLCLSVFGIANAQVYKWVDEHGKVHYGDRPPQQERASQITVRKSPSVPAQQAGEEHPSAPLLPGAAPKHHTVEPPRGAAQLKE